MRPERSSLPSMSSYRQVVQPPEILGRAGYEHWLGPLVMRHLSPYVSRWCVRAGMTPNQVTGLMILTSFAAAGSLLVPGIWGPLLCFLFAQTQLLLDCADGEVARWRKATSPKGIFLDAVGHYTAEGLIPLCLGLRAALLAPTPEWHWGALGGGLALILIYNKALNEFVHVARVKYGLPPITQSSGTASPRSAGLGSLRKVANLFPVHRLFHWVELSFCCLLAGLVGLGVGQQVASVGLLLLLTPLALFTLLGHFVAIMSSSKLVAD